MLVDPFAFLILERTTPFLDKKQSCIFRVLFMKLQKKKSNYDFPCYSLIWALRARIDEDTFKSNIYFFMNWIEVDSKMVETYEFASYRETMYCVLSNVVFSDRDNADLAIIEV